MKDNLEKAFKESLDQYKFPYDSKAWDAVNTQLSAKVAVGSSGISSALKWVLTTVLIGTVASVSYLLLFNEYNSEAQQIVVIENEVKIENSTNKEEVVANDEILNNENTEKVELIQPLQHNDEVTTEISTIGKAAQQIIVVDEIKTDKEVRTQISDNSKSNKNAEVTFDNLVYRKDAYVAGHISNAEICFGEEFEISNLSKKDIVRFNINGEWIVLKASKSYSFIPSESSAINFVNGKDEVIESKLLKVNVLPSPEFNTEANIFEEGMPVVTAEAYGEYTDYFWNFDNESALKGAVVKYHFFDKGDYKITLNVKDINGCKASIEKIVRIRDKFNLMAMDAFKPNGSDVRNRTFMPYSLIERDVSFQLTIVDPMDNGVVFTSSEADVAWDGTDQRTGKLTPINKTFIWKVQIFNPAPNERPIYAGTVVQN